MKRNKWWCLLFPHPAVVLILTCFAIFMLVIAFADPNAPFLMVYGSYVLSAYALTVFCTTLPWMIRTAKHIRENNRLILRYRSDVKWRISLTLRVSLVVNALYAFLQLVSGFYYHSFWFYALSGYYALLAFVRLFILRRIHRGEDRLKQMHGFRFCGVVLLVINQALAVIVTFIVWQNRGFAHNGILTIAMATYTFYSMTMAVINIIRYRNHPSPLIAAAKAVSFTSALVSVLSLETSMLSAFDTTHDAGFRRIMTGATGGVVCTLVLALAVYMIAVSTREIRKIKRGANTYE